MPILLDQSIPPRLVRALRDVFPDLESVYLHSLTRCADAFLFEWARDLNYPAILTANLELVRMARRVGPPPKIISIERSDYSALTLELIIRSQADRINQFLVSPESVFSLKLDPLGLGREL